MLKCVFPDSKQMDHYNLGIGAEYLCIAKFILLGFEVYEPTLPSKAYDLLVKNKNGEFKRIQVKATKYKQDNCYRSNLYRKNKGAYSENDIDIFCIYVEPIERWYVLPASEIKKVKTIYFSTRYDEYIENWNILNKEKAE